MGTFEQRLAKAWQKHKAFNADFATEMLPICIEHHEDALDLVYLPDAFNRLVAQGFMEVDFHLLSEYIDRVFYDAEDDTVVSEKAYALYLNSMDEPVQIWTALINDVYCSDWRSLFEYMVDVLIKTPTS